MTYLHKFQRVLYWQAMPQRAGGLLIQLLPRNSEEEQQRVDEDLWPRVTMLTETLKTEELDRFRSQ